MVDFRASFLAPSLSLSDALENINATGFRVAIVVDTEEHLLGLVTDGDIRKSLLNGVSLQAPLTAVMNPHPLVGGIGLEPEETLALMVKNGNECLPIVDPQRRVVGLVFIRDFIPRPDLESAILIMAGGAGKRLWPLTEHTPKPLLPVNSKPLLGHILSHAKSQGFQNVWVSTHYKADQVETFLDSSTPEGIKVNILREKEPLGTAGCLKSMKNRPDDKALFIMNGDILTKLDFKAMLDWHNVHGNILTVGCRQYTQQVPYGILQTDGQQLVGIQEKPIACYNINAGIYLVEREALAYIPDNVYFDMPDLIDALIGADRPVGTFPISEAWIDIGHHEDYERVNREPHQFLTAART
jgi:dTDP-glucose pyrophosphorylase